MAPKEAAAVEEVQKNGAGDVTKALKAQGIVKNYLIGSAAAGFIPLPIADMAAISLIQLKMLHSLANLYDVKFTQELGKSLIASLTGGIAASGIGKGYLATLVKAVPLVGSFAGMAVLPTVAGASTYAVGHVFIQHFESGGTFLDFDPEKVKGYFAEQFEKGKLAVAELKKA
jgi:uncharacterized protein (DUF697 family)